MGLEECALERCMTGMYCLARNTAGDEGAPGPRGGLSARCTWQCRESYSMYACSGILFNHELPRRRECFVTRKISQVAVNIKLGKQVAKLSTQTYRYMSTLDTSWAKRSRYCRSKKSLRRTNIHRPL